MKTARWRKAEGKQNKYGIHLLYDEAARAVGAADISFLWIRPVRPPRVEAVVSSRVPARPCMRAAPSHRIWMCDTLATDGTGWMQRRWRKTKAPVTVAKASPTEIAFW